MLAFGRKTFLPQFEVVVFQLLDLRFKLPDHVVPLGNFSMLCRELFAVTHAAAQ